MDFGASSFQIRVFARVPSRLLQGFRVWSLINGLQKHQTSRRSKHWDCKAFGLGFAGLGVRAFRFALPGLVMREGTLLEFVWVLGFGHDLKAYRIQGLEVSDYEFRAWVKE